MIRPRYQYADFIGVLFPEQPPEKMIRDLTFQITDDCNLCCSYCYQINKGHHKMSFEIAKKFIDYVFEGRTNPDSRFYEEKTLGFILDFIGGEPLLEIDLIDQICEYFQQKLNECPHDCSWQYFQAINLCSNGVLYFTPKVQHFMKKYGKNCQVNITIDGCKELHDKCRLFPNGQGSYDLALAAGLDGLSKGNIGTKITISPDNINYLYPGIKNMINIGFSDIYANCVFEDVWHNQQDIINYYNELKKIADYFIDNNLNDKIYFRIFDPINYNPLKEEGGEEQWCGTSSCMYSIDWKGDIFTCIRFMESSLGNDAPPLIIGNVNHGIGYTPEEKEVLDKFKDYNKKNVSEKKCLECPIESGCAWCAGCSYQLTKNLKHRTTTICECHKAECLATIYYYKKLNDLETLNQINRNFSFDFVKNIISKSEYDYLIKEV